MSFASIRSAFLGAEHERWKIQLFKCTMKKLTSSEFKRKEKKHFFFQKTNIFRAATMRLLKHFAFCRSGFQDKRNAGEKSGRKWVKMRQQVEAERKYKMRNSFRFRGRCRLDQDGAGKWNGKGGGETRAKPSVGLHSRACQLSTKMHSIYDVLLFVRADANNLVSDRIASFNVR